jgi:hypothetical protein
MEWIDRSISSFDIGIGTDKVNTPQRLTAAAQLSICPQV